MEAKRIASAIRKSKQSKINTQLIGVRDNIGLLMNWVFRAPNYKDNNIRDAFHRRSSKFRSNFRPAARYLYFHYCLQILRKAWKEEPLEKTKITLENEIGKIF